MDIRIRGIGSVSSYGAGIEALLDGVSAALPSASEYWAFPLPNAAGFKVNQFPPGLFGPGADPADAAFGLALGEALEDAELRRADIRDSALIVGTSGLLSEAESIYLAEKAQGVAEPCPVGVRGTGRAASRLAGGLGIRGPVVTITTACTSSANAILVAGRMIERGDAKRAVVAGIETLPAFTLNGFASLMLRSPFGCRPFDALRNGVQLGMACGVVILESTDLPSPPKKDALAGGANVCDTHNIISTNLDGRVAAAVISSAIGRAGITPGDIAAIKAHGTGSVDNDATEAAAMKLVFGRDDSVPPFTGLKGYIGHTLGACGAIEAAAFLGCLRAGLIPATLGFGKTDPSIGIAPLTRPIEAASGHYMLNFFGFGGNNTSLIFRRG
ncbi:MAG: hypothetical protein HY894_02265 [Deltaproteobacteria bacterium]|nr:hypothetical protein [Deltaproteobacteria bacterium]